MEKKKMKKLQENNFATQTRTKRLLHALNLVKKRRKKTKCLLYFKCTYLFHFTFLILLIKINQNLIHIISSFQNNTYILIIPI